MYLIYLRGVQQPTEITDEDYRVYQEAKEYISNGEIIPSIEFSFGEVRFAEIKAIIKSNADGNESTPRDNDMPTSQLKEIIGDYEKKKFRALMEFLESKGIESPGLLSTVERNALYLEHKIPPSYISEYFGATKGGKVVLESYKDWQIKDGALREMLVRREYAAKMDEESLMQLREQN